MNVIKVITIMILNYRYGINIIEKCDTCQIVICSQFELKLRCSLTVHPLIVLISK